MDRGIEEKYLKELAKGSRKAFETIYMIYAPRVEYFLRGLLKNDLEAEDMTQDIFYKVWSNHETIAQVDSFKSYLFRMAKNAVYNHYSHLLIKENYIEIQKNIHPYEDLVEEKIHAEDLELLIIMSIEKMPPQRKKIFKMSRLENLSNDEIATLLNISKRTVESHISQALADLRKLLVLYVITFL
ncbi:RNA polymerase sigma-70 factor [uncultured Parabacteroides sp.]|uniref:RNA polymerase sigma-70 factor n=1 Tax=uncultured Parabacteroides sp. TaxID=512312 RepID=UPI002589A220|nr:RNA polymerase sigma-70 factor [uncultured Parabacteroides sp.]